MLDLLRKIFCIHSPSKVQQEKIEKYGKMIAEGFAEGMASVDKKAHEYWQTPMQDLNEKLKENER